MDEDTVSILPQLVVDKMKVKVRVLDDLEEKEVELPERSKVRTLLLELKLREEGIVVIRDRKILRKEESLQDGDRIRILPIAIGG